MFDSKECKSSNGWAQFDTEEDASYFGQWINPFELKIVCYAEGDVSVRSCETEQEFIEDVSQRIEWHNNVSGYKFIGIDPGFNQKLLAKLEEMKLPVH